MAGQNGHEAAALASDGLTPKKKLSAVFLNLLRIIQRRRIYCALDTSDYALIQKSDSAVG